MNQPSLPREVSVPSWFRVYIPESARPELIDDGSAVALHLHDGCDPLYVLRYDLEGPYRVGQTILEDEAKRFLEDGVKSVCPKILGADIEHGSINGAHYAQLVAQIDDSRWWLARIVAKQGHSTYSLLHCNGTKDYLVLATAVLTEFLILE